MSLRSRHSRLGIELQPDEEQQEGDADFRHRHDGIGLADQAEHMRADDRAADDIAERRAEPELAEHGDEEQRRAEHERAVDQQRAGGLGLGCGAAVIRARLHRREQAP